MSKIGVWFKGLSRGGQIAVVSVATILGLGTVGSMAQPASPQTNNSANSNAVEEVKKPVVETKTITETEVVPFGSQTVESASAANGTSTVTTAGVNGVKTHTYTVTLTDGKEVKRDLVKSEVTTAPVDQVTTIGTYVAPPPVQKASCDSNYTGACVPIDSDVDCGGGSGNGPSYVYGTVRVVGSDIYDLDRDGNGYGCE